jgi:hypothetical protein
MYCSGLLCYVLYSNSRQVNALRFVVCNSLWYGLLNASQMTGPSHIKYQQIYNLNPPPHDPTAKEQKTIHKATGA